MDFLTLFAIYLIFFSLLYITYRLDFFGPYTKILVLGLLIFEGFNSFVSLGSYLPAPLGLLLLSFGILLLNSEIKLADKISQSGEHYGIFIPHSDSMRRLGLMIIISILMFNIYRGDSFGANDYIAFSFATLIILYSKINFFNSYMADFGVISLAIANFLLVLPRLTYLVLSDNLGSDFDDRVVYVFLNIPLNHILSSLGYSVFSQSSILKFYDMEGVINSVEIGRTCSGLHTVALFISFFSAYSYLEYGEFNSYFLFFTMLGILISYFANLIRMLIMVLVGIHLSIDAMFWLHNYIGWIIFTVWVFLFLQLFDKVNKYLTPR